MHKGRNYRNVLPRDLSANMPLHTTAPKRFFFGVAYHYALAIVQTPFISPISDVAFVDLPNMGIAWAVDWSDGAAEFNTTVTQQQFHDRPDYEFQIATFDHLGSANITRWTLAAGNGWVPELHQDRFTFIEERTFGLFDRLIGFSLRPVRYSEEP